MSIESEGARLSNLQDAYAALCLEQGYTAAAIRLAKLEDPQTIFDLAMINIARRAQDLERA